jgi:tight adherence protein C
VLGLLLFCAGSALSVTVLYVLILYVGGVRVGPPQVLIGLLLATLGAALPFIVLRLRIGGRRKAILRSLPDAFDLMTASVEAGLAIDAALGKVAERMKGPFAEELSQALREMSLGKSRRDALRALGQRSGVSELITFVNALIQAEQMGVSLGQVLRAQAEQMRIRRRQLAEAEAQRAPVKLLFPLVLGVLPALLIVVLAPAIINIYDVLIDR